MGKRHHIPFPEIPRHVAARLIDEVLNEVLTPRQALNRWPLARGEDSSLDTAYQALLYFESDEDRHRAEPFYIDLQLTLLGHIRQCLGRDQDLPLEMIQAYATEHRTGYYDEWHNGLTPFFQLKKVLRFGITFIKQCFEIALK